MTQKNSDFQTRLKEALAASPLSATALADKVGLSKQAISAYTSGVREPKRPPLRALAAVSYTHLDVYKRQLYIPLRCQYLPYAHLLT